MGLAEEDQQKPGSTAFWLEAIHQQWVATLDAIRDAIIVIDEQGTLLRANRRFCELTQKPIHGLIGKPLGDVAPWLLDDAGVISVLPAQAPNGRTVSVRRCETDERLVGTVYILDDVTVETVFAVAERRYRNGELVSCASAIQTLMHAQSLSDPYTSHHSHAVASISRRLARLLGQDEDWAQGVYLGSLIHDIGKISVPISILNRPGKLAQAEVNLIQMHPQTGYSVVRDLEFPWPIHEIILQHHERLDGSGYPKGLRGDEISLAARIVGVADVVEAISSHRPYRPALGVDEARDELKRGRGILYDADVVDACVELVADGLDFAIVGHELGAELPDA